MHYQTEELRFMCSTAGGHSYKAQFSGKKKKKANKDVRSTFLPRTL